MEKIKLFKVLVDKTWFCGEINPERWFQDPEDYTSWSDDLEEMLTYYNNVKANKDCESDAWEVRLCFIEVDEEDFLIEYEFDTFDLSDENQQDSLDNYCEFGWAEIQIRTIKIR